MDISFILLRGHAFREKPPPEKWAPSVLYIEWKSLQIIPCSPGETQAELESSVINLSL